MKKKIKGFFSVLFSMFFSLLLAISMISLMPLIFIHALHENVKIPNIGSIPGDGLALFLDSWYFFALVGALVLIPVLCIILVNTHHIRRAFLAVGCSAIMSALVVFASAIFRTWIFKALSGEWQDALVNSTAVFGDLGIIYAVALILIGVTCVSIYSCIAVVTGGKHEKNN